ncbi:hypothetical protein [Aestuariivivens sediminis]|uniref:hypothetical protein n=1 Tax=Aestuariivivens sediminis TaxID=2913557 RepID=UPI001F55C8A4|nr:hypothetical protein [Aestuariivivens sediminis]
MKSLTTLCAMLLITLSAASLNSESRLLNVECNETSVEDCNILFSTAKHVAVQPVKIEDVFVYELEEDVNIDFDTKQFLPKDFNPLKGLGNLDWNTIALYEIEEDVKIDFDTKQYLPKDFNPLKSLHDLDWTTIELFEPEEEVLLDFDTKPYLPANFNPHEIL